MVTEAQVVDMMRTIGLAEIAEQMLTEQTLEIRCLYVDGEEKTPVTVRLDTLMQVYALDAQQAAKEHFHVELDMSPQSLQSLDRIIKQQYESIPKGILAKLRRQVPDNSTLEENARMWSGYAGLVMHAHSSVTWGAATDENGRGQIVLIAGDLVIPIVKVTSGRIRNGWGKDVNAMFAEVVRAAPLP
jgi:hypothetical protein